MIKENIVLIADRVANKAQLDMDASNLEQIGDEYFYQIHNSLCRLAPTVTHYNDLPTFIDNIQKHKSDIVFTIYGGQESRNRMALVPGICESYNIKYVGADVYNRIICQDKEISKSIAAKYGLSIPKSMIINSETELEQISNISFPVVIKPLLEGSSIGIDEQSLCNDVSALYHKVANLQKKHMTPIMVEQFIPGKEVVTCLVGSSKNIKVCEVVEVYAPEDSQYFNNHLYTGAIKHQNSINTKHRIITHDLPLETLQNLKKSFLAFGKMDYMRIDGKFYGGQFYFIEFTPDASLGAHCSFKDIYEEKGNSYDTLLSDIIHSSLANHQIQ